MLLLDNKQVFKDLVERAALTTKIAQAFNEKAYMY